MTVRMVSALAIVSSLMGCGSPVPTSPEAKSERIGFAVAGHMTDRRYGHYSILLQDGRVLIGGGAATDGSGLRSAEIFDPDTGISTATDSTSNVRMGDTGTRLPDGRVALASANQHSGDRTFPLEIFDPQTGTFSAVPAIPPFEKVSSTALLPDGNILAFCRSGAIATITLATGEFVYNNKLAVPRGAYTATMLQDGRALITGGITDRAVKDSEIYDPSSNVITKVGSLTHERFGHLALPLPDGSVFIAGGRKGDPSTPTQVTAAERYNPTNGSFLPAGSPGNEQIRAAAVLNSGNIFFILRNGDVILYNPASGTFHPHRPQYRAKPKAV